MTARLPAAYAAHPKGRPRFPAAQSQGAMIRSIMLSRDAVAEHRMPAGPLLSLYDYFQSNCVHVAGVSQAGSSCQREPVEAVCGAEAIAFQGISKRFRCDRAAQRHPGQPVDLSEGPEHYDIGAAARQLHCGFLRKVGFEVEIGLIDDDGCRPGHLTQESLERNGLTGCTGGIVRIDDVDRPGASGHSRCNGWQIVFEMSVERNADDHAATWRHGIQESRIT